MPLDLYLHSTDKHCSKYDHKWSDYITYSTVNGINLLCSTGGPKLVRYFWKCFVIMCFVCSLSMIVHNVAIYTRKEVMNSMKIENEKEVDFPAITICNQLINKRVPTCDFPEIAQFARYLSLTPRLEGGTWTDKLQQEYSKYCPCPKDYNMRTSAAAFEDFQQKDYYESLNEYSLSIGDQFAYCHLNKHKVKCTDIFGGHLTDIVLCATFNMIHSDAINAQANLLGDFGGLSAAAKSKNIQANESGPNTGLKIILKVRKRDYCETSRKWTGVGYHVAVHQQNHILPLHFLNDFCIKFYPGYIYQIGIKITGMIQHTEHLNRCTSKFLTLDTGSHSSGMSYDRSICFVMCLLRLVYLKCHCFTRVFESLGALITTSNMNLAEINMSTPWCRSTHQMDFCDLMQIYLWRQDEYQLNNCPNCLPYCIESQYATTVSGTKINSWIITTNEVPMNETLDDLIVANFYLESMSVMYIYEDQAFTFVDLMIYVANTLNLFFGMSFLTMFELLLEALLCVHSKYF